MKVLEKYEKVLEKYVNVLKKCIKLLEKYVKLLKYSVKIAIAKHWMIRNGSKTRQNEQEEQEGLAF